MLRSAGERWGPAPTSRAGTSASGGASRCPSARCRRASTSPRSPTRCSSWRARSPTARSSGSARPPTCATSRCRRSSAGESVRARRSRASRSSPRCRSRSPAMWRALAGGLPAGAPAILGFPFSPRWPRGAGPGRPRGPASRPARGRGRAGGSERGRRRRAWGWGPTGRGEPVDLGRLALAALGTLSAGCAWGGQDEARLLPADRSAAVTYVALGDSTVEGVGASSPELNYVSRIHARLRGVYPAARLTNLGVGGATSADVLLRQLTRAIELRPYLVTLSIGPNDITGRVPAKTYEKNLETILARLTRETTAGVVANVIPDLAVTPRFNRSRERDAVAAHTVRFNDALARP